MKFTASRVLAHWVAEGLPIEKPRSAELISRQLDAVGLQVGSDYVDFLATTGGMNDHDMRLDLWSVWRLERVIHENSKIQKEGVFFADWCIHSHLHYIRKEDAHTSSVWVEHYDPESPRMVARSLNDFFVPYLARDETIGVYFDEKTEANESVQTRATSGPV